MQTILFVDASEGMRPMAAGLEEAGFGVQHAALERLLDEAEAGPEAGMRISGTDDGDGIELTETNGQRQQQCEKDSELPGGAEKNDFRILHKRLKIRHRADADENQERKYFGDHPGVVKES